MKTIVDAVNLTILHLSFVQNESYSLNSLKIESSLLRLKGEECLDKFKAAISE
jgi:hypothetical protein